MAFEGELGKLLSFFCPFRLLGVNVLSLFLSDYRKKYAGKICIVQKFTIHLHRI